MFRFFNRLIILLFIVAIGSVVILISGRESDESLADKYSAEASNNAKLIGRFIEHILHEREDNLEDVAASPDPHEMADRLQKYSAFIDKHYSLGECFSTGITDSGFEIIKSISLGADDCSVPAPKNYEIVRKLKRGEVYIGLSNFEKNRNMILIYPVMRDGVFSGSVYDIFTVMDEKGVKGYWNGLNSGGRSELIIDDIKAYGDDPETQELIRLKSKIKHGNTAEYNNRQVGFYCFSVHGTKFCLVYTTEQYKRQFVFSFLPWAGDYAMVIVFVPLGLLIMLIITEMFRVNKKLSDEIADRTRHLNMLNKKNESLFQTIPEYIVVHDKNGNIIEQNSKFRELECQDGNSQNILDYVREKDKFRTRLEALHEGEVENFGEFSIVKSSGEIMNVSVSAILMETDGTQAVLSVFTDITDYKNIQNSFYLAQRREAVGTLASGMAHDFSNILQNISLQFGLAERADDAEKREQHLESINGIVDGARMYIQKVLQSARDTEEKPEPRFGRELTSMAVDMASNLLPPDVSILYSDTSEGMMIKIAESRFIQMMVNLCQNAAEAMDKRGVITVTTSKHEMYYGMFFELRVKDTGRGIDKNDQKNMFKPFYTTKQRKGAGLGLATVKQVVMDSGGFIEVHSAPGEGCEFIILLPETK
ncbi:nitrogen regulation protein NR(II) [Seleniivibrio woodruffii]|uniref:two-component system sensor histidine kinase NtrB n=1 Tax=Seleniivibrio woodruffii TaxID=1078050 RepID=UPI0026F2A556|nr:ATP-binding protein [Seleniivibrio woodruffii]